MLGAVALVAGALVGAALLVWTSPEGQRPSGRALPIIFLAGVCVGGFMLLRSALEVIGESWNPLFPALFFLVFTGGTIALGLAFFGRIPVVAPATLLALASVEAGAALALGVSWHGTLAALAAAGGAVLLWTRKGAPREPRWTRAAYASFLVASLHLAWVYALWPLVTSGVGEGVDAAYDQMFFLGVGALAFMADATLLALLFAAPAANPRHAWWAFDGWHDGRVLRDRLVAGPPPGVVAVLALALPALALALNARFALVSAPSLVIALFALAPALARPVRARSRPAPTVGEGEGALEALSDALGAPPHA